MTIYRFGDIVTAPFPFTNQRGGKQRPVVVISAQRFNANRPDVVVMPITTNLRPQAGNLNIDDWQSAGLRAQSTIKPVIATLETQLIGHRLGRLKETDAAALVALLRELLSP